MKISSKSRHALAAMMHIATSCKPSESISVISISEKLGTSKIYLEQIFALLKKSLLLTSTKGAQGGYRLARDAKRITVADILQSVDFSLFEKARCPPKSKTTAIDETIRTTVYDALDEAIYNLLKGITLEAMAQDAERRDPNSKDMYYI